MADAVTLELLMETVLAVTLLTSFILLVFRKRIPARVNCWFCNSNHWVPYHQKNSWICIKCEQYNGFKQDGSYNVVLDTRTTNTLNYNKKLGIFPPSNGFCHKCNTNQQLKIMQLASFIPMNDKKFDSEIDAFKLHLEKVYQLCSGCKKYLKHKLSSEKGLHLNSKLINLRHKSKDFNLKKDIFKTLNRILNYSLKLVTITLLMCIIFDIAIHLDQFLSKSVIYSTKKHFKDLYIEIKNVSLSYNSSKSFQYATNMISWVPSFSFESLFAFANTYKLYDVINYVKSLYVGSHQLSLTIDILSTAGLILQILRHTFDFNISCRHIFNDIIWGITVYNAKTGIKYLHILQACFVVILLMNYRQSDENKDKKEDRYTKAKLKNLSDNSKVTDGDDTYDNDSDSDVSSCFNSIFEPRSQSRTSQNYFNIHPHNNNLNKNSLQAAQSLFDTTHVRASSIKSYRPENVVNYNKIENKKWDVELNQSISDLNLGCDIVNNRNSLITSKHYDEGSLNLFMPSPSQIRARPILSPSRLSHGTQQSWVAGGYWGADNRLMQNAHETSSSSSQSSGFESLTSSTFRRNINSFPPSRENSISKEYERRNDNPSFYGNAFSTFSSPVSFKSFHSQKSPVFPTMKPNESIHIPQIQSIGNPFDLPIRSDASNINRLSTEYTFLPLQKSTFSKTNVSRFS